MLESLSEVVADVNIRRKVILYGLLSVVVLVSTFSGIHLSLTYDEPYHYRYGRNVLWLNSDRFDDSKMPFSVLNVIPVKLIAKLLPDFFQSVWQGERLGRISTVFFSVLLAYFVFIWSRELFGEIAGFIALGLYALEPNLIAHSRLITTDLYVTCMIFLSLYFFWHFIKEASWNRALVSSIILGLSQLAKYTSLLLYPLLGLLVVIRFIGPLVRIIKERNYKSAIKGMTNVLLYTLLFVIISILIINLGFLFNRTFTPLGEFHFKSDLFQTIQSKLLKLDDFPIPVPYPFIEGLDSVRFRERTGIGYGKIYLLSKLRSGESFPGYFIYATIFKVPIIILLVWLISIVTYLIKDRRQQFLEKELFLLGPILFFTIYFNFFFRAQIGIRFFLIVFPFLFVFSSRLFQNLVNFGKGRKLLILFAAIYLIVSVVSYFPHYISYFNEFIWDKTKSFKVLADSNLDWGQSEVYLRRFLLENPGVIFEPNKPLAGRILISANRLIGIRESSDNFAWLREHFEPIDHIAYSYLLFDVTQEELEFNNLN